MPKKGSTFGGPPVAVEEERPQISLEELEGALGDPYNDLPPVVRRRVDALANLHKQYLAVQKQYQAEVAELEKKYAKLYDPILDKRAQVISGAHEPTDEESKYERKLEEGDKLREAKPEDAEIKGIPQFWLASMQNNPMVGDAITENDEEALSYLRDVRCTELDQEGQHGFTLTFHFAENPFFSNTTLTKTYLMEEEETFGELLFDHATGSKIDWKAGKNLTIKQVKKKVKAKGKKPGKMITVDEPTDSFFNFFSPPEINDETDNPEEAAEVLEADFDIGCIFKDKLIPYSLLWFTGEAAEYEDFGDFDDDEEFDEDEDDEEEEDEEEEEEAPPKKGGGGGGRGGPQRGGGAAHAFNPPPSGAKGGPGAPGQPPQPECKQQ
jgi:nucleosome assembly protein 1-like 1